MDKKMGGSEDLERNLVETSTKEALEKCQEDLRLAEEETLVLRTKLQLSETSEKLYRSVTEHAYDMIMRFAPDFTHLYANNVSERYLNIPAKDLIGKTHKELGFKESDYAFWEQEIQEVFNTGKPKKQVTAIENGSQWFDWWLIPEFNADGKVESVLSYSRDISNIKEAEQRLLESEIKYKALSVNLQDKLQELSLSNFKLNESNQKLTEAEMELRQLNMAKDKLLSIISHDMKNPIAAIWTSCELLLKYLESHNIERAKSKGEKIMEGIEQINQMLNDLLQWSMLQLGLLSYKPEKIELNDVTKNCIAQISIQAELKNITLKHDDSEKLKI
jgi:PAS domain S-box-containing protein